MLCADIHTILSHYFPFNAANIGIIRQISKLLFSDCQVESIKTRKGRLTHPRYSDRLQYFVANIGKIQIYL